MKVSTVLQKINNQYNNGIIDFETFITMLTESCEQTIIKERISLIKKFAKVFEMDPENVENKILPKKKRHITAERLKHLSDLYSKQPILYREIIKDGEYFQCEMEQYGLIYGTDDNDNIIICGHMKDNVPIFLKEK